MENALVASWGQWLWGFEVWSRDTELGVVNLDYIADRVRYSYPMSIDKIAGYAWRMNDGTMHEPCVCARELTEEMFCEASQRFFEKYGQGVLVKLDDWQALRLWRIGQGLNEMKSEEPNVGPRH